VKAKKRQQDLSIIIVSYNTADLIGNCLDSILANDDLSMEAFVVDNGSNDESVVLVKTKYPAVHIIANANNLGFATANNQVLPMCNGRYILFLNPDTEAQPDSLTNMISYMDANPRVGLAGAKIINPDRTSQWSVSYKYPGQKYAGNELSDLPGNIACVLGASMVVRSDLIKKIGGFDEKFFLYGEDQDLCLRIRKAGHEIGYIDSAPVVHIGGQSERNSLLSEVWEKKTRAEYIFYQKHYLPKTIRRIRRADILKAWWRIMTLKLSIFFVKDNNKTKDKLTKYMTIHSTIKHNFRQKS